MDRYNIRFFPVFWKYSFPDRVYENVLMDKKWTDHKFDHPNS